MPRYRFYSCCPICLENEKFYWVHSKDDGDDYIWDNCDLECDKCHNKSFILKHKFKCGMNNHNEYESVDASDLIYALSMTANIPDLSAETRRNMRDILKKFK
jgi:hypothetical protein